MSNKCTFGQLFNFMSTIENTGETTYDLWRSLEGNENGTVEEFLSYLKDDIADSELSETSTNPVQNKVVTEKLNKLFQSCEDTDLKLNDYATITEMKSAIAQSAKEINLGVSEVQKNVDDLETNLNNTNETLKDYATITEMQSAIDLSARNININVSEVQKNVDDLETNINESLKEYVTTTEMESAIELSSSKINFDVNAVQKNIDDLETNINASLELKVDTDKLISEINASADVISLTGNRFIVESDNLTITEDGTITAKNGKFTGTINAEKGTIGGFNIKSNCLETTSGNIRLSSEGNIYLYDTKPSIVEDLDGNVVIEYYSGTTLQDGHISLHASQSQWGSIGECPSVSMDNFGLTFCSPEDSEGNVYAWATFGMDFDLKTKYLYLYEGFIQAPSIRADSHFYLGEDMAVDKQRAITTYWQDLNHHYIVERGKDGLTAAFGWAGASGYTSISKIRGQTCQVQNASGTSTLSDERLKKDFTDLDKWEAFYDALEPVAFKMKTGNSGRYHIGFKAQQVEQALLDSGLTTQDFAGFIKMKYTPDEDNPEGNAIYEEAGITEGSYEYGLIYSEFTAINTYEIQKLKNEVKLLKKELETLK